MTLVQPHEGRRIALEAMVNKVAPQDLDLALFTNNYTPVVGSVAADFTEASGSGYARKQLVGANWVYAAGAPSPDTITYPEQIFTFTGALGNVYGYYVVQRTSGKVLWGERFSDAPFNVTGSTRRVYVTPVYELGVATP